jgi:serine/threonine protein kinase
MHTPMDGQATGNEQTVIGRPFAPRYEAGTVLSGKYRLEALLGEGGMGAVWRASNLLLDLPVAIKLIRADLDRGALRARLQLEARSAAKLGHPAIVRVYDVGESELGDPFIVMEHLRGESLAQLISRGRLPAIRVVQLLLPIIDALAMAHGRGIVHRDLKPDNLMIAFEDQQVCPKILDFGIAKLTDPRDSDHKLTEAGAVLGSPEYMSPEQARGRDDIDASTDIWSLCVALYEALTGCPPFSASNCNALLRCIVEDAPKSILEHAAGDAELWRIIERGLHKDRAQRYAKISELGQALAGWLVNQGVTEDACGSSLDAKWLCRRSDLIGASQASLLSAQSDQPQPTRLHDSNPNSTGIGRGPFTKTILPSGGGRTRTLGMAFLACALLAVSLLALGRSPHANARTAGAPTPTMTLPVAPPKPTPPASLEPPVESALSKAEVRLDDSAHTEPQPETKRPTAAGRSLRPIAAAVRVLPPAASVAPPSAPTASKSDRSLDLLAPY